MAIARLNAQTRHSQQARKSLGTRLLMDMTFKHRWIQVTVTVDELAEVCNEYSHNCVLLNALGSALFSFWRACGNVLEAARNISVKLHATGRIVVELCWTKYKGSRFGFSQ